MEVDKRYKVTSSGMLKPAQLPIFIHKFVFFDATSCIDIICVRIILVPGFLAQLNKHWNIKPRVAVSNPM